MQQNDKKLKFVLLTLLLYFFLLGNPQPILAQSGATTANANGVVTDEEGRVIVNASVTAINLQTNQTREIQTNEKGLFLLNELPPGNYEISAFAEGFAKISRKFNLTLGTTSYYNFILTVEAKEQEIIEVIANNILDESRTVALH